MFFVLCTEGFVKDVAKVFSSLSVRIHLPAPESLTGVRTSTVPSTAVASTKTATNTSVVIAVLAAEVATAAALATAPIGPPLRSRCDGSNTNTGSVCMASVERTWCVLTDRLGYTCLFAGVAKVCVVLVWVWKEQKNMSDAQVVIDSCWHENLLASLLADAGLSVERRQLKTADVMLYCAGRTILIELKSCNNFVADYTAGGRHGNNTFRAERSRLAGEQVEGGGAVSSILLLHGIRPRIDDQGRLGHVGNFTPRDFHTSLQRTALAYGVHVAHAGNTLQDAANWIALAAANLQAGKFDPSGVQIDREARPPDLTRKTKLDASAEELVASMLAALPGVSVAKAKTIAAAYPSLGALAATDVKELASLPVGAKKLGPAVAKRIKSLF
jgi:ERCC4-type nuclease